MIKNEDYKKFWLNLFDQKLEIDEEDFFRYRNILSNLEPKEGYPKVTDDDMEAALIWLNKDRIPQA